MTRANESERENDHATVREAISLAYNEYKIEINTSDNSILNENVKLASTQKIQIQGQSEQALAETGTVTNFFDFLIGKGYITEEGKVIVANLTGETLSLGNGTGDTDIYKFERKGGNYILKYYGENKESEILWQVAQNPEEIDWDSILADANANPEDYKHPDQSDTNGDIGIGADGNPVNMDKWNYTTNNNEISLVGEIIGGYGASSRVPAYSYEYDEEGNVITDIVCPRYIKEEGTDEFYEVTYIGEYAFSYCSDLTNIVIPDSVTGIGGEAFSYCDGLERITIPDSVTSIGNSAFHECSSLLEVNYNGTKEQWNGISINPIGNETLQNATIHCTDGDIVPSTE